ncbi:MAG: hypothetical protein JWQ79_2583 [Mucilaginibacter sp.]|nr:hypothetical protein [Mucilaginibacter sp.]
MKLLTCLFILITPVCLAQTFTFNQGGTTAKNYYVEIPYENINGKIFVEGTIAGKKHRFLFDTGAPVAISKELAAELNVKELHKVLIGDTFLHSDSATVVKVDGIDLGGIVFNGIPAITDFPDFYKCYQIDGVIGSNILRNSIISIVSSKHIIVFTDQANKLNLKAKNSVPLISNLGLQSDPTIRIVMKDKLTLTIPFDTGDSQFLRVSDKMIADLKQYELFDMLSAGYGSSGLSLMGLQNNGDKYLYKVAFFTVGNGRFNNLIVESNQTAIPAIGSKLLDYGRVTLDFIHGKFYFDATEPVNDVSEKQWPFRPTFSNGKYIVGVVWNKATGILKQGDQIMAVNDMDYSNVSICDLLNNPSPLNGIDTAVLTIKDTQGSIKKVTVKKE